MIVTIGESVRDGDADQNAELARIAEELTRKHPEVPADHIQALVQRVVDSMPQQARVTDFIPVLVINEVSSTLRRTAA